MCLLSSPHEKYELYISVHSDIMFHYSSDWCISLLFKFLNFVKTSIHHIASCYPSTKVNLAIKKPATTVMELMLQTEHTTYNNQFTYVLLLNTRLRVACMAKTIFCCLPISLDLEDALIFFSLYLISSSTFTF